MGVRGRCSFQQTGHFLGVSNWQAETVVFFQRDVDISGVLGRAILICLTPWRNPCDLGKIMMVNLAILMKVSYFLLADFRCIVFFLAEKKILSRGFFMIHHEKRWIHVDCGNFTRVFFPCFKLQNPSIAVFSRSKIPDFLQAKGDNSKAWIWRKEPRDRWLQYKTVSWRTNRSWMVVSDILYFHPYFGKIPIWTNIFQMGLKPPTRIYLTPTAIKRCVFYP